MLINLWVFEHGDLYKHKVKRPLKTNALSPYAYLIKSNKNFKCKLKIIKEDKVNKNEINLHFHDLCKSWEVKYGHSKSIDHTPHEDIINWCLDNNIKVIFEHTWENNYINIKKFNSKMTFNLGHSATDYNSFYFLHFMRKLYDFYYNHKYFNYNKSWAEIKYNSTVIIGRGRNNKYRRYFKNYFNDLNSIVFFTPGKNILHNTIDYPKQYITEGDRGHTKRGNNLIFDKMIPPSFYESKFNVHFETHIVEPNRRSLFPNNNPARIDVADLYFITEKTVKLLISNKPGYILGGYNFNKHLSKILNIELYDEIFDYDSIDNFSNDDNHSLWAQHQSKYLTGLCKKPASFFTSKITKDKCNYNLNCFLNFTSDESFYKQTENLIEKWYNE